VERTVEQNAAIDSIRNKLIAGCSAQQFAEMTCPICNAQLNLFVHPNRALFFVRCVSSSQHLALHAEAAASPDWWAAHRSGGWLSHA
jgi:hypothetical protein